MTVLKRFFASSAFQQGAGAVAASYLQLVWASTRHIVEPANIYDVMPPSIITFWHGQHLMTPFLKREDKGHRVKALISRHRDGELNTRAAERLGIGSIRGSGAHNGDFRRKGGASAFGGMLEALAQNYYVALTADVPKVSRIAGPGIIKLAQHSGRPIYSFAIATQHRIDLNNWDRTAINLPFGRLGIVAGEPIFVDRQADEPALEAARQKVESELNRVTARAYAIVDSAGSEGP